MTTETLTLNSLAPLFPAGFAANGCDQPRAQVSEEDEEDDEEDEDEDEDTGYYTRPLGRALLIRI